MKNNSKRAPFVGRLLASRPLLALLESRTNRARIADLHPHDLVCRILSSARNNPAGAFPKLVREMATKVAEALPAAGTGRRHGADLARATFRLLEGSARDRRGRLRLGHCDALEAATLEQLQRVLDQLLGRFSIMLRRTTDRLKQRVRPEPSTRDVTELEVAAPDADPADLTVEREHAETVRAAIEQLSGKQREALTLCDLQGRTREETARLLCTTVGAVHCLVCRGRAQLKRILAASEPPTAA
jgi:hypothetical protein